MLRKHYPDLHPLPNLRRLCCEETYLHSSYTMFTSLTLKEVEYFASNDYDAVSFLHAMVACPYLENLFFVEDLISPFANYNSQAVQRQLCETLLCLSHLKEVQVGRILPAALQHLATLPQLKELHLFLDTSTDIPSLFDGSSTIFPALSELQVTTSATPNYAVLAFLDAIRHSKLRFISIFFEHNHERRSSTSMPVSELSGKTYINRVIEKISQITTLEKIYIDTGEDVVDATALRGLVFDEESLSLLLGLKGITTLSMHSHPVDLPPDAFRQIASAWPALEILHLGEGCLFEDTPEVNVEDLLPLTTACPQLTQLGVLLGGNVSPASLVRRPRTGQSKSHLETLYLGKSVIANPAHLAVFLSGAFPCARVDEGHWISPRVRDNAVGVEVNAMLASIAQAEKLETSSAMGPLRPTYGKKLQCPHSMYSVRDVATGNIKL